MSWQRRYYAPYRRAFAVMSFFFILKSACVWLSPVIMARLIDLAGRDSSDPDRVSWGLFWAGLQLFLLALNYPTTMLSMQSLSRLARGLSHDLRLKACEKIHQLSYLQQERYRTGILQAKAIHDIETIEQFPRIFLNQILATAMSLLVIIVSISVRAPLALLIFTALIPIGVYLRLHFQDRIKDSSAAYRQAFERLSVSLHNYLSMNLITKAHGLEHFALGQLEPEIKGVYQKGQHFDMQGEKFGAASFLSFTLIQVLFLFISVYACMQGSITVGDIVMFNAFFASISGSLMSLVNALPTLSRMQVASQSLDELFSLPIEAEDRGERLEGLRGQVEFRNVSFRYPGTERDAISDLSFTASSGGALAFVGPSGCGKTTIMSLILGLLQPTRGSIFIDGVDLASLNLRDYRRSIGLVTQDCILLSGSIFENVAYGLPAAREEDVIEALRLAEAWGFVAALPEGLWSRLGDDGLRLSGGQKQRLSLARALIRKPRILVLDEATSAVDIELEYRLQETLKRLMQGRTIFIVSHRAPTIAPCEQILVLSEGCVAARGRHEELLTESAFYRHLSGSLRLTLA